MSLQDYVVARDKFELTEDAVALGLDFPCRECKYRHNTDAEEPCRTCDHNANAQDS